MKHKADIGVIGLGVMGRNLILNMNDHGFLVTAYNRTPAVSDEFLQGAAKGTMITGALSLAEMVSSLKRPRKIMLMVKSGKAVDELIALLLPLLQQGDIIIDGGNSHFLDTGRRVQSVEQRGLLYVGAGISGGEEGARLGPSIMPGGSPGAWPIIKRIFQSISARTDDGTPCCDWIGGGGAGHYVKMVHNGIEYGEMQAIAEACHLMHEGLLMDHGEMSRIFSRWNRGGLESYLMEITAEILASVDENGSPMLENILDVAGQKGTGSWSCMNALELGVPVTVIAEAVSARFLSRLKEQRIRASGALTGPRLKIREGRHLGHIRSALLAGSIVCWSQGFSLMREASKAYGWELDPSRIALVWRKGTIIRCAFLDIVKEAFDRDRDLPFLFLDPYIRRILVKHQSSWRKAVVMAVESGVPVPVLSAGLAFYDGYRHARLPADLIQAQRDYFGSHMYERIDRPRGELFHTNWKGC
jgi:6-phosphogluconate dehydrogenase